MEALCALSGSDNADACIFTDTLSRLQRRSCVGCGWVGGAPVAEASRSANTDKGSLAAPVIGSFMTIGVVFIAIAIAVLSASNQVLQASVNYSAECTDKLQKRV